MKMDTRVFPDLEAVSRAALEELLRVMREAIDETGPVRHRASRAGTLPRNCTRCGHRRRARERTRRGTSVHLFWGDERYVPYTDPLSNYRMAGEALIAHVPIPAANVHPMPGPEDFGTPDEAAEAYEAEMRRFFGSAPPAFDLQLLGLGVEGHTASLFPGSPALGGEGEVGGGGRGAGQATAAADADSGGAEPGPKHVFPGLRRG